MKRLVLVPQHFGSLVFDRRSSRYFPFDAASTEVLREWVAAPWWSFDGAPAALVAHFEAEGWSTPDGRLSAVELPISPPQGRLSGPLAAHVEIMGACNLACTHCFASPLPRHHDPLTLPELDGLFATLASMGCFRLGLTGGEPLMRRDLLEILDAALARGLHPCLTTNALLLTESLAMELGRRKLVWLNVSLDGATAESNDRIRGAGTFHRVCESIALLRKHAKFTLAFTLTSTNAEEVQACATLAESLGASTAVFRPLYPTGAALDHPELLPSFAQYQAALSSLDPEGDVHAIDPFSPQSREGSRGKAHGGEGCGAGNLVCSISVSGEVNPCSFLGAAHDGGNIRTTSFAEIWHHSQAFRRMRGEEAPEGGDHFSGGCRVRSRALNGSVWAPDPWQAEWAASAGQGPGPEAILEVPHG